MSTKTEERLIALFESQTIKQNQIISDKAYGLFLFGFISGIVFSYSGFGGYLFVVISGIMIGKHYDKISSMIVNNTITMFSRVKQSLSTLDNDNNH